MTIRTHSDSWLLATWIARLMGVDLDDLVHGPLAGNPSPPVIDQRGKHVLAATPPKTP